MVDYVKFLACMLRVAQNCQVAKNRVPAPHGFIIIEANSDSVHVDSTILDSVGARDEPPRYLPTGKSMKCQHAEIDAALKEV